MPTEIALRVPDIGDSKKIEVARWYFSEGDQVEEGDCLCELITDKAAFPLEAPHKGRITKIQKSESTSTKTGDILAYFETA